ncbi:hypothetical protein [uncultured Helicobacter sp.]|uniref:hypothetical protein n=1 Tax=uncultured Helicobacter sp. TaxID=175537 RepID=UPI0026077306|nr:hypothetical protein [uncultured Helicobacter sp.]
MCIIPYLGAKPWENKLSQLQARVQKVEKSQKIYGAKERVQNHLNCKLGLVIVESQNIFKKVILPFRMARIVYLHKKQLKILQSLYALNPHIKPPELSQYSDLQEALSYQNSIFYQTGERFPNSCKQWSKGKFIKIL